jgi:hypothetical protein
MNLYHKGFWHALIFITGAVTGIVCLYLFCKGCIPFINPNKDIIDFSTSLLTPLIAIFGSIIAWQQFRINRTKLKHELFEKRFRVFEGTKGLILSVIRDMSLKYEDRYKFFEETKGELFLFEQEIHDYLDMLLKKAIQLRLHEQKKEHDEGHEILIWFTKEIENVDKMFDNYLKIKE